MTQQESYPASARDAYDAMAPIYDRFNAANDYEVWLGEVLLPELHGHGLRASLNRRGPRLGTVLDVGCGTGRAFPPLIDRGWEVLGVDASNEMLERAWDAFKGKVSLIQADARDLPNYREGFDLVLLLNDVVNYLTEDGDLERCFSGVKRNLAEGGLVCFDANTLGLFESSFVAGGTGEDSSLSPLQDRGWSWTGLTTEPEERGIFEAALSGEGVEPAIHRERHWTLEQIEEAMEASGLRCLAVLGQREEDGKILLAPSEDDRHYKTIYIGGHDGG